MEREAPGETYIISGKPRDAVDVLECAEEITGVSVPRVVSPKVFAGLASIMGITERIVPLPEGFEAEALRFFTDVRWPVDNSKASEELGITHRPLEEGLRDYLEWELAQLDMRGDAKGEPREVAP
ncbi:hypothetical protein [Natronococcus amylolyticus]|nr:hypothetical protein [Natronococcus amylolyticus]